MRQCIGATNRILRARQTIHAPMVVGSARAVVVRCALRHRQNPKIVVERMVFLHYDDDVFDLAKTILMAFRLATAFRICVGWMSYPAAERHRQREPENCFSELHYRLLLCAPLRGLFEEASRHAIG